MENIKYFKEVEEAKTLIKRAKSLFNYKDLIGLDVCDVWSEVESNSTIGLEIVKSNDVRLHNAFNLMDEHIHELSKIVELAELGRCDNIMVARIKMAECEIISLEKQIEIAKGTLK